MSGIEEKSFSARAKDSLIRTQLKHNGCMLAEVAAAAQATGSLVLSREGLALSIQMEHPAFARRIFGLIKELTGETPALRAKKNTRLRKTHTYTVLLSGRETVANLLQQAGVMTDTMQTIPAVPKTCRRLCCKRAYLRALFLACGSISNPEKNYHLEFSLRDGLLLKSVAEMLEGMGIHAGLTERKDGYVLYIKDGNAISDLLAVIGANTAILEYENTRILKQTRNNVNRAANCINANVDKTVDAAQKQIQCIRFLQKMRQWDSLTPPMKQAAEARLAHPEATIAELALMMSPPVAKSGMNHRLRKLCSMAELQGFSGDV